MVIAVDAYKLAYMALPKAGCSSVKEALARLDPDTLRAYPLIMVMRGRTLDALGRAAEALDALDRALAWSVPGSVSYRHAERLRAALVEAAFATLRVRCRPSRRSPPVG